MMNKTFYLKLGLCFCSFFLFCSFVPKGVNTQSQTVKTPNKKWKKKGKRPKFIFYLIGDGMSIAQITMAESALKNEAFRKMYLKQSCSEIALKEVLNIRRFPIAGMANTHCANRLITDSAAAATALATGHKTSVGTISMNSNQSKSLETIAEKAKRNGAKVGIVSSVSIDHATPACFYAHVSSRGKYEDIGNQLLTSNFDYFGGGSVRWASRKKLNNATDYAEAAKANGYQYIDNKAAFQRLSSKDGKVIATLDLLGRKRYLGDGSALPYTIDNDMQDPDEHITLSQFAEKGIEILENKKGFFMMIEGGKIDWCGHANDATSNTYEVIAFDQMIGKVLDFYEKHKKNTLIVITGDHECGGLTLGFAGTHYSSAFKYFKGQTVSFKEFSSLVRKWKKEGSWTFDKAMKEVTNSFGLGTKKTPLSTYEKKRLKEAFVLSMGGKIDMPKEEKSLIYGGYDPFTVTVTHILNNKAGVDWTSYSHTALPVPVFAIGVGADYFSGYYDNTDIPKKMAEIAGWE